MRSADNRLRKYTSKFDPTVVSSRFTTGKDLATTTFGVAASQFVDTDALVKQVVETEVGSPIMVAMYMAMGKQIKAKQLRYGGKALYNEANAIAALWTVRGLDAAIIAKVLAALGISTALYGS
jgi:hypothetical protein